MKKLIIIFDKLKEDVLVSLDCESCSSKELFEFLGANLWTFSQKKAYNTKVKDIIKEYLIDMGTCAKAIEKNNQIWEEKFEKNNQTWETRFEKNYQNWMQTLEVLKDIHKSEINRLNEEIKKLKGDK
ncbi:hypothetical protein [Spiroplasma culicicola]|nr:hypothetical protein [Spiroplasma culicicola]